MSNMDHGELDWFDDDAVSFEGALAHFETLGPAPTAGPLPPGVTLVVAPPTRSLAAQVEAAPPAMGWAPRMHSTSSL